MNFLFVIAAVALAAPEAPAVCAPPPARDVAALTTLAQRSGALSVGLDSVATWCFDSAGVWTGGAQAQKKKLPHEPEPVGDCAKAVESCERARADINAELRALLEDALKDLERPYLGARYVPRRSGLGERPAETAECRSRTRSALFAQAQARMDVARLASQAQNEYANYRTWLYAEGLKCADAVARGVKDPTNRGISVDAPVQVDGGSQRVATVGAASTESKSQALDGGALRAGREALDTAKPRGDAGFRAQDAFAEAHGPAWVESRPQGERALDARALRPGHEASPASTLDVAMPSGDAALRAVDAGLRAQDASAAAPRGPALVGSKRQGERALDAGALHAGREASSVTTLDAGVLLAATPSGETARGPVDPGVRAAHDSDVLSATRAQPGDLTRDDAGLERSAEVSLLEKWRAFSAERTRLEADLDWASGFLASRELRDCKCVRADPAQLVRKLEGKDVLSPADEVKAARCEVCLQDSFPGWKARTKKQCTLMDQLTDFELGVLERSDDGNGLPPRCFALARARRGVDAGSQAVGSSQRAGAFIVTRSPEPVVAASPAPAAAEVARPIDYAPIPAREAGRAWVRVFMSSACVADIEPGPMQARTGDLLPVPLGARALTVKSACGGLVEVYWGKEEKPRISETFGRNQPLKLEFQ